MNKTLLAIAAASLAIPAAPAVAQQGPPSWAPAHGYRDNDRNDRYDRDRYEVRYDRDDRRDRRDRRRYREDRRDRAYDDRGRYYEPRRVRRGDRVWQGNNGQYHCERENGTTGLIIGAAGGALLGRTIDTRGDRTVGTLLGGALGAVLGREIDRGGARCR
ncbi:MAG: glycine zipper 2TM domain-containing protein [Alteraurantiacibacter sp.]